MKDNPKELLIKLLTECFYRTYGKGDLDWNFNESYEMVFANPQLHEKLIKFCEENNVLPVEKDSIHYVRNDTDETS